MHIVYLIIFTARLNQNILPYYYIGSKSNAKIVDGRIISRKKVYRGSSKDIIALDADEVFETHILYSSDNYDEVLRMEKMFHLKNDVVADPRYFNKSIATINAFSNPKYGTFIHAKSGKIARLPIDHPSVIDRTWVGVTKGKRLSEETKRKISGHVPHNKGKNLPDYQKRKSSTTKLKKMSKWYTNGSSNLLIHGSNKVPEGYKPGRTMTSIERTASHNRKIGDAHRGRHLYQNLLTGQIVRLRTEDIANLDLEIWVKPREYNRRNAIENSKNRENRQESGKGYQCS